MAASTHLEASPPFKWCETLQGSSTTKVHFLSSSISTHLLFSCSFSIPIGSIVSFYCFLSFAALVMHFVRLFSIVHTVLVSVFIETHCNIELLSFNWWVLFFVVFQSVVLILVLILFLILCS